MNSNNMVVCRPSDDTLTDTLEVRCSRCDAWLCAIVPGVDSLSELARKSDSHVCANRIEVLVYRDPDADSDVRVFVDGAEAQPGLVSVVDPGKGWHADDWEAERQRDRQRASQLAVRVIDGFYADGARTAFVEGA